MSESTKQLAASVPGEVLVTGATGFVGSGILRGLGRHPNESPTGPFATSTIRSLARKPGASLVGVEHVFGDVTNAATLSGKLDGVQTVVHLVGIIEEHGSSTFDSVIRQGTENIVSEASRAGVTHFVLMSALGAQDNPDYPYHQAKYRAEEAVKASGAAIHHLSSLRDFSARATDSSPFWPGSSIRFPLSRLWGLASRGSSRSSSMMWLPVSPR